jgi:phosphotransferase system HPr (HPr) family protein
LRSIELDILNASGLHARPAALFVRTAGAQWARIQVTNVTRGTGPADAKSLLSVLGLGVSSGHRIAIVADGADEVAAIDALRSAVEGGLGEVIESAAKAAAKPPAIAAGD